MSTAHRPASPSRHALALLALFAALPPTLRADECIPTPEEGIFCGEEPPPFEMFWVHEHSIYGDTTETWNGTGGAISSGFSFDRWGYHGIYYIYTLTEGSRLTITGNDGLRHRGVIQGAGSLRILSGSLRFDPTNSEVYTSIVSGITYRSYNTYSGGTEIAGGRLQIYDDASLGSGPLSLSGAGALQILQTGSLRGFSVTGGASTLQTDADITIAGTISGDGRLNKTGSGTATLATANTHTGGTAIPAGALSISDDDRLGTAGTTLTLGDGATLIASAGFASSQRELALSGSTGALRVANASDTLTWNGATSGSGKLVKQGAGKLVLAGGTGHTGGAQIDAGTLEISVSASLGGTGVTSWSGPITGSGDLVKSGAGTLELSGAATHSGYTTLRAGTLRTTAADVLSPHSALFLIGGSTLDLDGHDQTVGDLDSYNLSTGFVEASTVDLGGATLTNLTRVINLWAGNITGEGTLVKKGSAEMKWYAANTFAGTLQIDAGKVSAQAANVFSPNATVALGAGTTLALNNHAQTVAGLSGAGNVTLGSAALTLAQSSDNTFSGVISGPGSLVKNGAGILTLSGANTFSGGLTLKGGTLSVGADAALGAASGRLDLDGGALRATASFTANRATAIGAAGGAFDVAAAATLTWSGMLDGAGNLAKTGAGLLALTGDASGFSGDTAVQAGTLSFRGALGSGSFSVASGATLDLQTAGIDLSRLSGAGAVTGTADFLSTSASDRDVATSLGGSGGLRHSGTGTLALSAENHYTGGTTLSAGAVSVAADSALGDASGGLVFDGGTLETTATLESARAISLVGDGAVRTAADTTLSGEITGDGSLAKTGAATLTLAGANTYAGGTTVQAGTLRAGHADAFGTGAIEISGGGALDLNGLAVANAIVNRGGTLTGLANFAGTQTIAGPVSFSGTVGGSIDIAPAASLDSTGATFTGPVNIAAGGTLSGTGALSTVTVAAGGLLSPGNSPGLLTIGDGSILSGTTLIELGGLDRGSGYDAIDVRLAGGDPGSITVGGTLDVVFWGGWTPDGAASFRLFQASSFGGTFAQINLPAVAAGYSWNTDRLLTSGHLDLFFNAIPEPSAFASLAGAGALGLALLRRRPRRPLARPRARPAGR